MATLFQQKRVSSVPARAIANKRTVSSCEEAEAEERDMFCSQRCTRSAPLSEVRGALHAIATLSEASGYDLSRTCSEGGGMR